jgi:hypothetical protein
VNPEWAVNVLLKSSRAIQWTNNRITEAYSGIKGAHRLVLALELILQIVFENMMVWVCCISFFDTNGMLKSIQSFKIANSRNGLYLGE